MVDRVIGKYKILAPLGSGGMGTIWKAQDLKLGRLVALKFLHPHFKSDSEQTARLLREAQAASALDHPNICTIYEVSHTAEGQMFIAMAYYEGLNVRQTLEQEALPLRRALDIALQTARGLEKAHASGISHRDINPSNLIVTTGGVVKLVDFGLAKLSGSVQITQPQAMMGTPAYMAPEQITGETVDHRADLWALGIVMFEMGTGRPPFEGATFRETVSAILQREPVFPPGGSDLQNQYWGIVRKALAKDVRYRYQRAAEMVTDLEMLAKAAALQPDTALSDQPTVILPPQQATAIRTAARQAAAQSRPAWPLRRKVRFAVITPLLALVLALAATLLTPKFRLQAMDRGCAWAPTLLPFCALPPVRHMTVLDFTAGPQVDPAWANGLSEEIYRKIHAFAPFDPRLCIHRPEAQPEQPGFTLVIDGAVQGESGRATLQVRLRSPRSGQTLRQFAIAAPVSGFSRVQDQIDKNLAAMLDVPLELPQQAALGAGSTEIPEAFEHYLSGLGSLRQYILSPRRQTREQSERQLRTARNRFEQALKEDPYFIRGRAMLADCRRRLSALDGDRDQLNEARAEAEQAISQNPDLAMAHEVLGDTLRAIGEYTAAGGEFRRVLQLEPGNLDAAESLSEVLAASNQLTAARAALEQEAARRRCWLGYARLGEFCRRRGMLDDAERAFRRSVEQDPDNPRPYNNLAALSMTRGHFPEAENALLASIRLHPTASAWSNLGTVYYYLDHPKNFRKSAEAMEKARDLAPSDYRYWFNLGEMYALLPEKRDAASGVFQRTIELAEQQRTRDPGDAGLLTRLANSYAYLGDPDHATEVIEQALRLAPGDVRVQFAATKVYAISGNLTRSLEFLDRALRGGYSFDEVRLSEPLDSLRKLPGYLRLEREFGNRGEGQ